MGRAQTLLLLIVVLTVGMSLYWTVWVPLVSQNPQQQVDVIIHPPEDAGIKFKDKVEGTAALSVYPTRRAHTTLAPFGDGDQLEASLQPQRRRNNYTSRGPTPPLLQLTITWKDSDDEISKLCLEAVSRQIVNPVNVKDVNGCRGKNIPVTTQEKELRDVLAVLNTQKVTQAALSPALLQTAHNFIQQSACCTSIPPTTTEWNRGQGLRKLATFRNATELEGCYNVLHRSPSLARWWDVSTSDGDAAKGGRLNEKNLRKVIEDLPLIPMTKISSRDHRLTKLQTSYNLFSKWNSWISVGNVCASCETDEYVEKLFFMNPKRPCHMTLWSTGGKTESHFASSKLGRHKMFRQREGGFQYGGALSSRKPRKQSNNNTNETENNTTTTAIMHQPTFYWVDGTTHFSAQFEVFNIGHALHDAAWGFAAALFAAMVPKRSPVEGSAGNDTAKERVMFDADFWRFSGGYYAMLNSLNARYGLSLEQMYSTPFIDKSTMSVSNNEFPIVCFENLILSGTDRNGVGAGNGITRHMVAEKIRKNVFSGIDSDREVSAAAAGALGENYIEDVQKRRPPQVLVYGRSDVYRRSIDNIQSLFGTVQHAVAAFGDGVLPRARLIKTFDLDPVEQVRLIREADVLVAVQGAHLQHSLFMAPDGFVLELAPCHSNRVSFLKNYGAFLETQKYEQHLLCSPPTNLGSNQLSQNVTLCPHHLRMVHGKVTEAIKRILKGRRIFP